MRKLILLITLGTTLISCQRTPTYYPSTAYSEEYVRDLVRENHLRSQDSTIVTIKSMKLGPISGPLK